MNVINNLKSIIGYYKKNGDKESAKKVKKLLSSYKEAMDIS